jgi:aspartate/methionine/tyrosine aminotransferase
MSKDFGGSGLRFGVCHTKNEMLLNAMNSMCDATMISNLAQQSIGYLLGDHQFCQTFIDNNKIMLRESYFALKGGLEGLGLKLVDAHSGIFALADLRGLLRIDKDSGKKESEESLEMRLRTHKIFLTPGRICKCPIPGFFRYVGGEVHASD